MKRKPKTKSKVIVRKCQKMTQSGTSTRDTVIRLEERVLWIADKLKSHCDRHWYIEGAIIIAAIGYVGTLIWNVVQHLAK